MLNAKYSKHIIIVSAIVIGLTAPVNFAHAQVTEKIENPATVEINTNEPVDVSNYVDISAHQWVANIPKNIAEYTGDVVVKQKELTLYSDRLTVFFQDEGDEDKKNIRDKTITRFDVSGSVKLTTKNETIHSTWGIYDVAEKIVTLGGKVILETKDGNTQSDRLTYNLKTGQITMTPIKDGRVKGKFKLPKEN